MTLIRKKMLMELKMNNFINKLMKKLMCKKVYIPQILLGDDLGAAMKEIENELE